MIPLVHQAIGPLKQANWLYRHMQMAIHCVKYTLQKVHIDKLLHKHKHTHLLCLLIWGCNVIFLTAAEKCLRTYYYIYPIGGKEH